MLIETSAEFRKKGKAAIFSIILFIIVYILLFLSAIALTVACIAAGIFIIAAKPMFLTLMLGVGLASVGVLISYFLIKFLFKKHLNDRSYLTEITQKDEPQLFEMISEIVNQTGTDFPKKVYLSYDVNASVFYDSTFWSMFLPIKKNLTIGIGLVNTCTKQELKAILAHEFGHFSQKSMKVGSYVYNVNQIIFNLVNDDETYKNTIQKWASTSGYFALFAGLAIKITEGIKWILSKMYTFVNIRHLALSREMEFHADEVAANIAGSLALEESLLRIDLADNSYNSVLNFYENKIQENKASRNIYKEQSFVMNFLARESELETKYNLPVVRLEEAGIFNKSKLVIENQWASHPSTEERVAKLRQLNITQESDNDSARLLFKNFDETEEKLTQKLFSNVKFEAQKTDLSFEEFQQEFQNQYNKDTFDKIFNSYYDNKNPTVFDIDTSKASSEHLVFEALFDNDQIETAYTLIALKNDKATVEAIGKKELDIKTFDYDGTKYRAADAKKLIPELDRQINILEEKVLQNDVDIYHYFSKLDACFNFEIDFKNTYAELMENDTAYPEKYQLFSDLRLACDFISVTTPFEQITKNFNKIRPLEMNLKSEIKKLLTEPLLQSELTEQARKDLNFFTDNELVYFGNNEYRNDNLQHLIFALNNYHYLIARHFFLLKKTLLDKMASLQRKNSQ